MEKTNLLEATFLGWSLNSPTTNGSGPFSTTIDDLYNLAKSGSGFITTKTITFKERKGNRFPRIYVGDGFTINSEGLPNPGYKGMAINLNKLRQKLNEEHINTKIIASVGPFNIDELKPMIEELEEYVDGFELNLSCPNVNNGRIAAANKPIMEWLELFKEYTQKKTIVKLPPYLETGALEEMAEIIVSTGMDAIATINSLGNALVIKDKKPVLAETWGGLAGKYIKPIGLGNVHRFYKYFKESGANVEIVGIGGIFTGKDAFEYLLAGANVVGLSSAYMLDHKGIYEKINKELEQIMERENYKSVKDIIGSLEEWN